MKILLPILAVALTAVSTQAQERAKQKPTAEQTATSKVEVSKEKPQRTDEAGTKKEELDINFRAQEQRVRHSIYTLGGKLTPPGRKPGQGC